MLTRRSFLKLTGAAAVVGTGLVAYAEPVITSPYKRWVKDKGDWYEVFVPSGKSLRYENFDKPVLLLMGQGAIFDGCRVNGFVNCYNPKGWGLITESFFDSRGMTSALGDRAVLNVHPSHGMTINHCVCEHDKRDSGYEEPKNIIWHKVDGGHCWTLGA